MFNKKQYWEMPATREDVRKLAVEIKNSQELLKKDVSEQVVAILLGVLTSQAKKEYVCTIK